MLVAASTAARLAVVILPLDVVIAVLNVTVLPPYVPLPTLEYDANPASVLVRLLFAPAPYEIAAFVSPASEYVGICVAEVADSEADTLAEADSEADTLGEADSEADTLVAPVLPGVRAVLVSVARVLRFVAVMSYETGVRSAMF
jgi:hypothetical protein